MKDYDFFPGEGKFYKANLHCHTVISDGKLTKEQIKEEYQKRGYSIVAFTDHRTYGCHPELTDENFIALAGIEVDVSENPEKCGGWPHAKCYHLNSTTSIRRREKSSRCRPMSTRIWPDRTLT